MDYDQSDAQNPMGMDGCLDWTSPNNLGLSSIWNDHTDLHRLWESTYADMSVPDFWVASANAVVRITSNGALDMRHTYYWGRPKADTCEGSADRLPKAKSCREVEETFLERMGMRWRDAVALLGGHTIGLGHAEVSISWRSLRKCPSFIASRWILPHQNAIVSLTCMFDV